MKSFNFKAIDTHTINLLSMTSVLVEHLPNRDKLRLLQYIMEPKGELTQEIPSLSKAKDAIQKAYNEATGQRMLESDYRDMLEKLEGFIRDSSESERLILNEMIVGTRGRGLWYQGDEMVKALYGLAGIDAKKLPLFKAYIAALPVHERTMAMSYLLSTQTGEQANEPGAQLLRMMELHKTPGIKFAQMASILGIFGPEESHTLAKAKDRSSPISLAETYEQLREVYTPEQFARVKRVKKLAGSGGIKHVVFVEFNDGTTEAVYLKRKFLEETIDDTLGIVTEFTKQLQAYPEYATAYEYDYYLETLRKQLTEEVKFKRELNLSQEMQALYKKVPAVNGWKFEPVPASTLRPQTEQVLHFKAIDGVVPFEQLSAADQRAVSELLVQTELDLLLKEGRFDADRHLGNYLFDPKTKRVYAIDFSQVYGLKRGNLLEPGDRVYLARILRALSSENKEAAARELSEVFIAVAENRKQLPAEAQAQLQAKLLKILQGPSEIRGKILALLGELTQQKVHLPLRYSLGIFKGVLIVTNEEYAKLVPAGMIEDRLKAFAKKALVLDALSNPGRCLRNVLGWLER
ncbi:AarF/UbiB family protein [Bdellovibrionota bacterium FG-1]